MKVNIEHGIDGAKAAVLRSDSIIIVDAIRASTTYVNAFSSGAKRIVPCSSRKDLETRLEKYPNAKKNKIDERVAPKPKNNFSLIRKLFEKFPKKNTVSE